jgi:magnesium chelatase family protein
MDRIDLHVEVSSISYRELAGDQVAESSAMVRERVTRARHFQVERQGSEVNAALPHGELRMWTALDDSGQRLMEAASERLGLSARGVKRVLRVARTIADLEGAERIAEEHLAEAVQYRGG